MKRFKYQTRVTLPGHHGDRAGRRCGDYLAPGERFVLWRGHDLGSGVVTRRIFV